MRSAIAVLVDAIGNPQTSTIRIRVYLRVLFCRIIQQGVVLRSERLIIVAFCSTERPVVNCNKKTKMFAYTTSSAEGSVVVVP